DRRCPGGGGQHCRDRARRDAPRRRLGGGGRHWVLAAGRRLAGGPCHGPHLPMLGSKDSMLARCACRGQGPWSRCAPAVCGQGRAADHRLDGRRACRGHPARGGGLRPGPGRSYSLSMLRYTASKAAFCSSSSRASARITDSTEPGPSPVPPRAASAPCSSSPASASSVSADTLSASASSSRTRTDGWCSPRSIWLRYGFDRLVSSASWRSDRFASLRWVRMKLPRAFIWASHASVMGHLAPGPMIIPLTILST